VRWWISLLATGLRKLTQRTKPGRSLRLVPARYLAGLVVVLLVGASLAGRGFAANPTAQLSAAGGEGTSPFSFRRGGPAAHDQPFAFAVAPLLVVNRPSPQGDSPPILQVEPLARSSVVTYTVAPGDTLDSIAEQFEVADYTIFWVNGLHSRMEVVPGLVLSIPPLSGVPHTVQPEETLNSIADMYGVRPGNIVGYPPNGLKHPYHLKAGQQVFVPGGCIEVPRYWVENGDRPRPTLIQMPGGERLSWPARGYLSAPFGWSWDYVGYHYGTDIANAWGTRIFAAAAGTVIESGWDSLGWHVVIDHGNGFETIYGHLAKRPMVAEGEQVERGQQVGSMGRTYGRGGYATGVHLHFAVRHHGAYIDPLPLLE